MRNSQILSKLTIVKNSLVMCMFLDKGLKSPTMNSPTFLRTESSLKGLPMTSKAASGYFGQSVWNWIERNVPNFEKSILTRSLKDSGKLTEGAGKFPRITCGIVTCRDFCLHPQVILPAEHFTCSYRR